ncbi:response regulator transcription factor [Haliscomenobacter sp.]|uniref:response regulator transcription factor n=1 Tax=Haliscomenobacter sp. TaxID=2717303 RepID=UPI003593D5B9
MFWEAPIEQLQDTETWQERQPDLLVAPLPIDLKYSKWIQDLQDHISFRLLYYSSDLNLDALDKAWITQPEAILIDPITEAQMIATLRLIQLNLNNLSKKNIQDKLKQLSLREQEIVQLIRRGLSSKQISERLFISTNTVNTHKRRIKEKLQVKRFAEIS